MLHLEESEIREMRSQAIKLFMCTLPHAYGHDRAKDLFLDGVILCLTAEQGNVFELI